MSHHHRDRRGPKSDHGFSNPYKHGAVARLDGSRCSAHQGVWDVMDSNDEEALRDDLSRLREWLTAAIGDEPQAILLFKLRGTEELSDAALANFLNRHRGTMGRTITRVLRELRKRLLTDPACLATLPDRFRRFANDRR